MNLLIAPGRLQILQLQLTNEFEVVQVIRVDIGGGVDLKGVVVLVGVLKQAVHRVQHLRRKLMMSAIEQFS